MGWFKKLKKSLRKHSKRILSKDYWTGKKGSYLGHLAFAGLGPIATVPMASGQCANFAPAPVTSAGKRM